ncbi:MAG: ubiquinone/menaquinone biosynthesis methyltransferase [Anaerolineae bacterium]|nr:ubiquinone/menaquinone biosynthesis methyltransferase [Anaerolineae bacterium]
MTHLQGTEKSAYVQDMFGRVARRYNLMNRLISMGQDQVWRRFVVKKAQIPNSGVVLDLATGTGDIAFEVLHAVPTAQIVGADFSLPMMVVGKDHLLGNHVNWCAADAMNLPFPEEFFDAVLSGYLVRNVVDIRQTLREQLRILKPGGSIVILDSSPPPPGFLRPFILIHLKYVIPLMGRIISGKEAADAYRYLPESTQAFKTPRELAILMEEAGIQKIEYKTFMFGTIAIHWGQKAP